MTRENDVEGKIKEISSGAAGSRPPRLIPRCYCDFLGDLGAQIVGSFVLINANDFFSRMSEVAERDGANGGKVRRRGGWANASKRDARDEKK